jgi:hypothetical protein
MNLPSQRGFSSFHIRVFIRLGILFLACFTLNPQVELNASQVQTLSQESEDVPSGEEKILEDKTPQHLPIKVKVKNLNKKRWVHEIEVEVTNTSDKPIYFLLFYLSLPEVIGSTGMEIGFQLRFGRIELIKFITPLMPTDAAIKSGEVYTFKIPKTYAKGWDNLKNRENLREPKRVQLIFQALNFGDGTGFTNGGGKPVDMHKKVNLNRH